MRRYPRSPSNSSRLLLISSAVAIACLALTALLLYRHAWREQEKRTQAIMSHAPQAILERLSGIPLRYWSYIWRPGTKHLGFYSQDFYAQFGVGGNQRKIYLIDVIGVLFAAIQALDQQLKELAEQVKELKEPDRTGTQA
jgi:hypothetical protein